MGHEGKIKIPASGEMCPCGSGAYNRFAICDNEKTDGLNLHYDICSRCGFETYAHCKSDEKLLRFREWNGCQIGHHTEARLASERIISIASSAIAIVVVATAAAIIYLRVT